MVCFGMHAAQATPASSEFAFEAMVGHQAFLLYDSTKR